MGIAWIDQENLELENKRVFLRVDFNVPVDDHGEILDDSRIKAALDTINFLIHKKSKIVIASHMGRPKGKFRKNLSLEKVAERLSHLLDKEIVFVDDCVGDGVKKIISDMSPSQIVLLENLRFHSGEEKNDESFARQLALGIDIYVNDAFGAVHRAHASVDLLPFMIKARFGGFLLRKELEGLTSIQRFPKKPFVAVLGGAKVSDKIGVIIKLLPKLDTILIGGAMAYTFLRAKGIGVGNSRVEEEKISTAKNILDKAASMGVSLVLPVDHVVAREFDESSMTQITEGAEISNGQMGVDIGPKTQYLFSQTIRNAQTIFFNGPMGVFEWDSCFEGTHSIIQAMTKAKNAFTFVGGGDSIAAVNKAKCAASLSHLSTGGGASLEFLEGEALPGLVALGY